MLTTEQTHSISSSTLQQRIGSILRRVAVDGEHITIERTFRTLIGQNVEFADVLAEKVEDVSMQVS